MRGLNSRPQDQMSEWHALLTESASTITAPTILLLLLLLLLFFNASAVIFNLKKL